MATFFEGVTTSYADIDNLVNDGIPTEKFLLATEDLIKLFDFLNPTAFAPVKSDMSGNVKKIRDKYIQDKTKFNSLQEIVLAEAAAKDKKVATEGLMWLRRGLEFTAIALRRNLTDESEELNVSFTKAYEQSLAKHHNMFIKPVFYLAMKACPYRKEFYKKIGGDDYNVVKDKMNTWLSGLEKNVKILQEFYTKGKHEF